ncbi:UDP-glucose 4-epimerase GalE [Microbacterium invictum]|uniref:UDP-glucose 4-epimerase n=1 Tax=Microbacterium invictum TaxID=515415 RepID=A0AA40VMW8_9MICO|nr:MULTISPECIES: UDP-glucose 4-epimerase GalE [Microbacterium]MBB4140134.1 UDP-glucose 4-epimerase [Microbacterium invictum]
MRVLLAGGAGYIGAHTALALVEAGHEVIVVDNLSNSSAEAIARVERLGSTSIPLLVADARDEPAVLEFTRANAPIDAIVNFAGLKSVGESVSDPVRYYEVNLGIALSLLNVMTAAGIRTLVFSSSATVYGVPSSLPLTETAPTGASVTNPYGRTKHMIEEILRDAVVAHPALRITALRYFNPVGAHGSGHIGEDPAGIPNNLMPYVARVASGSLEHVGIFGDDYETPDGTGLRDYIHVVDLAAGHVAALERAREGFAVYNLGIGVPVSVREVVAAFERAADRTIPQQVLPRRAGDVAASYCDPSKAEHELDWAASLTIDDACRDAWNWQRQNPTGYLPTRATFV